MIREEASKWLLYMVGALVTLTGLAALLVDFLHNFQVNEYGAFIALLVGVLILIGTTYIFYIIPRNQQAWRMEKLRQYYIGRPGGELLNINHDIAEAAQAAIMHIEIAAESYQKCVVENMNVADCMDNIDKGKSQLDQVNASIAKLKKYGDELGRRINDSKI